MSEDTIVGSFVYVDSLPFKKSDFWNEDAFIQMKQTWDSLHGVFLQLQADTLSLSDSLHNLKTENEKLLSIIPQLEAENDSLDSLKPPPSPLYVKTPNGFATTTLETFFICVVLIFLIKSVTTIALKKDIFFSKGNVTIDVGKKKPKKSKKKSSVEKSSSPGKGIEG